MTKQRANDLVPLSERGVHLQALRVAFAMISVVTALIAPQVVGTDLQGLILATATFVGVAACFELIAQRSHRLKLWSLGVMLCADAVYLAWVMYLTGGTGSPLRFLLYMHLIAVTLLASYRTGLKLALWHSLLFFVVFYAQAAEMLTPTEAAAGLVPGTPEFNQQSLFNVSAFWLVAFATAAFSALNERELRRGRSDLEALSGMSAGLKDQLEPEAVGYVLLGSLLDSFGYKRGFVALKGAEPDVVAYRGPGDIQEPPGGTDRLLAEAWESGSVALVAKPDEDENPGIAALMPFARNLVVAPMRADGEVIGAVVLEAPPGTGSKIERRVVIMTEQFVAHGALAMRNSLLLREMQTLADTDGLTGLANRRSFQKSLEREVARCARTGDPVSLLLLDVDHFKRFNDTHGHQLGDEVLRRVGAVLTDESREFDIPSRYGGEEFAVIIPNCGAREAAVVGERLRRSLRNIEVVDPITVSAGIATYPANSTDVDSLIRAADEALYASKNGGRDRLTKSRQRPRRGLGVA